MSISTPTASLPQRVTAEMFGTALLVGAVLGTAIFAGAQRGLPRRRSRGRPRRHRGRVCVRPHLGRPLQPGRHARCCRCRPLLVERRAVLRARSTRRRRSRRDRHLRHRCDRPRRLARRRDHCGFASNGFGDHSPGGFGLVAVIIAEVVLTAVFLYVILGVTDRRATSGFAPLAIGLTLTVISPDRDPRERCIGQPRALDRDQRSMADPTRSAKCGCLSSLPSSAR